MASPLAELEALIPPTRHSLSEHDWTAIEQRLRLRLPADYKRLVEAYGLGSFDRFIWILQPTETNQHLDLFRQRKTRLDALRVLQADGEVSPFGIEADHEALVPWAITDNGDVCYWVTDESKEPEEWTVAVNEARGPRWETFEGSASAFLLGVISRSLGVGLFPEDFPSDKPTFEVFAT